MGAAIGIGLASMGNAFMKSYNDTTERKRRQEIEDDDRAWKKEERDAVRQERTEKAQLKRDLGDAVAPRTTMTDTVTQSDAGQVFSDTPENARAMQDTLAAEAELRGDPAPTQQAGHAVTGSMTKGHQIATGAVPDGAADTPDARNERILDAYRKNGQFDKAIQMEESIIGIKAKQMDLSVANWKYLDAQANREIAERIPFTPDWGQNAANFLTSNKSSPLKGLNVKHSKSDDGKTVNLTIIGHDGDKEVVWSLPDTEDGWGQLVGRLQKTDLSVRLAALNDQRKQEREQANKDRDYKLEKDKADADIGVKTAQAEYYEAAAGAKDAGVSASSGVNMDAIDKQLTPLFKTKDETDVEVFDTDGMAFVRKLALSTPEAASGDATGAALRAHKVYTVALGKTGGDHQKAVAAINQAMAPKPSPAAPAAPAGQPGAQASSATQVAPNVQAARDSDARSILQSELAKAQQRLAAGDARAQVDIQSISNELRRMGAPVAGMAMQEAAAPTQQTQPPAPQARPAVAMTQAPAAAPVAPAAPPVSMQAQVAPPSVAQILAGPSASPAIVASAQQQAQVIEQAAALVKNAQAKVAQAASRGDQAGIKAAMNEASTAGKKLREMLSSMNPPQAAAVIKAVGLQ